MAENHPVCRKRGEREREREREEKKKKEREREEKKRKRERESLRKYTSLNICINTCLCILL